MSCSKNTVAKTGFWEYAKVFGAVEFGAWIGAVIGVHLSSLYTSSNMFITGGVLSGDFIGGTIGQLGSYWYNNSEKFNRDGKTRFWLVTKDFTKIIVYDIPVTAVSYAATSQATYYMLQHSWNKTVVATASTIMMMSIWNGLNYCTYTMVKTNSDKAMFKKINSMLHAAKIKIMNPMFFLLVFSLLPFLFYGIIIKDMFLITGNFITLIIVCLLYFVK